MNPMHRDTDRSAGLHLFQELFTLAQQLAHTLLFREGCGGVLPMFQRARRDRSSPSVVRGLGCVGLLWRNAAARDLWGDCAMLTSFAATHRRSSSSGAC
jgi:hypothetical protein